MKESQASCSFQLRIAARTTKGPRPRPEPSDPCNAVSIALLGSSLLGTFQIKVHPYFYISTHARTNQFPSCLPSKGTGTNQQHSLRCQFLPIRPFFIRCTKSPHAKQNLQSKSWLLKALTRMQTLKHHWSSISQGFLSYRKKFWAGLIHSPFIYRTVIHGEIRKFGSN